MKSTQLQTHGDVVLLTMNQADENRFNADFTKEIRDALATLEADNAVRALVLTGGNEKFFSNGLDLNWMIKQKPDALEAFLIDVSLLLKDTALFGKPLIGAINGHAFGLGCIWSSGFDFRLMREDRGWACFPEMDINIPFLPGMIAICEHGLGTTVFREMAYSAKRYSGPDAVKVGWAREALPKDRLLDQAIELAHFMAKKQQPAFGLTKKRWAERVATIIDQKDPAAIRTMHVPGK